MEYINSKSLFIDSNLGLVRIGSETNAVSGTGSSIVGGKNNYIEGNNSFIAGGSGNQIFANTSFVFGNDVYADQNNTAYLPNVNINGNLTVLGKLSAVVEKDIIEDSQGSQVVCVDKNRTDTYTPDGSELKPFKTIRDAFTFVGNASSSSDFLNINKRHWSVKVAAGSYDETSGGDLNVPKRFFVKLDLSDGASVIGNLVRDVSGLVSNTQDHPVFVIEGTSNRPYFESSGISNRVMIGVIGNISMINTRGFNSLHLNAAGVRKVEYSGAGGNGHFFTDSNSTWDTVYSPTKQVTFYTYNTQNSAGFGTAGNLIGNIYIANVSDTRWIFNKSIFTTSLVFFRLGANISLPPYSERRASTFTRSGNVATVTLTENHGFSLLATDDGYTAEQYVLIQGASENTSFNTPAYGARVIAYPSANTIQYESTGVDVITPVTAASAKMVRGPFFGNANTSGVTYLGADGRFSESAAMTFSGFAQASELGTGSAYLQGLAKGVSYSMPLTSWPASTILTKNTILILDDQFQYRTTTGVGRTSAVQPTFPTIIGAIVNDGFVTWVCEENSLNRFDIPSFNVQSKLERLSNAKNIYLKSNVLSAKNVKDALEQTYNIGNSVYTYTNTNSAFDQAARSWVNNNSAREIAVSTVVNNTSANWNSVYSNVNSNSATYATILFTNNKFLPLSGGRITGNLSVLSGFNVTGNATINGNVSATKIIYSNELDFGSLERPSLTGIKQALNSFLYISPSISYLRINGGSSQTLEVGQALSNPTITWNSNKVEPQAVSNYLLTLPNASFTLGTNTFTFSSYNDPNTYNITNIGGTATQQTSSWSVRVTDWTGAQSTSTTSANWRYRVYFGVTSSIVPNSVDILNGVTSDTNRPLATSRTGLGSKTISPSNQYFYVAYPQRFGTTSTIRVNGLNFTDFTQQSIATFTNASGGTDSYYVYRSNNLLTATYTIEII